MSQNRMNSNAIQRLAFSTAPPATLLPRAIIGGVFLLEGILKFLNPGELGVGRFIKLGIPVPAFFAPFDGVFEIGCGILLILGLMTRLAAIPMIINMIVAITSSKIPLLLEQGFWKAAHEARLDFSMLLGCIFLLLVGAGSFSLDSLLASRSGETASVSRHPSRTAAMSYKTILTILAAGVLFLVAPARTSAGESGVERTVEVRLTEYKIEMPLRLAPGPTLFRVTNAGSMFHRFEIEGKGMEMEIEPGVDAGQTKTLKLDLKTGAYEVYCPVHGHKKAGMSLRLQVG
ncbi:MAG TPA: DoxX family membrane protein [Candidatus Polarisedimenticolia bacterium]|nr:DoxX family membrane protein [Candidatus Polarisedimenticolia bacterium]